LDDQTFAALLGEDGSEAATTGSIAAETTAIGAAVPNDADVPEDEESVEADQADQEEGEGAGDQPAEEQAPAPLPISDPRHPDHGFYLRARQADQVAAQQAAAQQAIQQMQAQAQIRNTIQALPDTDPDKLIPTVTNLIGRVVAPVQMEAQQHAATAEAAAGVATTLHLALKEMLPDDWVAAIEGRSKQLGQYGNWRAAQEVSTTTKQIAGRESAELTRLRQENADLRKGLKANGRNPNADRVGAIRPSHADGARGAQPAGQKTSQFDTWWEENMVERG
jgi:hypothetical protein